MKEIFGQTDRMPNTGKIKSEYPSWYFDQLKDDLSTTIDEQERALESDAIPSQVRAKFKAKLHQRKTRLEAIEAETPKLSGAEKEEIVKMRAEVTKQLQDAHPKRSERERGLVDDHEEAKRMSEPCCELKSQATAEFAKACGMRVTDGKITRNDMDRIYKISSKMVGESTDVEYIRRP